MPSVLTSIPSPPISSLSIGPVTIHLYALCILTGIVVATLMTNRRLTRRGAEPWVVIDILILAVPLGLIGARFYHVFTHASYYFREGAQWWNPFEKDAIWNIWDGGIAIFGALIGGAVGAWLGCRWTGVRFWSFADALAPGLLMAQALGRFGNWFNQELFGLPTDLPWGLEISADNPAIPSGLPAGTLFHPTFLYEVIWNSLGVVVLLWAGTHLVLRWGRLFGLYLVWYGAGRIVWENIRIDPSDIILGLRTNVWAAILAVVVGVAILIVQGRRHASLEPSVYAPGRERGGRGAVQSQNTDEYVDTSEPPAPEVDEAEAMSTTAAK
ncbi:prolipoprotein diacylglyceryl transferase [Microbacterium sp.]|uniref:prolipoprotein diacylglyceryl transferase n=1 Tax=Microbacterium sp. TaxID=51671 RepID=UPI0039E3F1BC